MFCLTVKITRSITAICLSTTRGHLVRQAFCWRYRQHRIAHGATCDPRPGRLCRFQRRRRESDPGRRPGTGRASHSGQLRDPRIHPHGSLGHGFGGIPRAATTDRSFRRGSQPERHRQVRSVPCLVQGGQHHRIVPARMRRHGRPIGSPRLLADLCQCMTITGVERWITVFRTAFSALPRFISLQCHQPTMRLERFV